MNNIKQKKYTLYFLCILIAGCGGDNSDNSGENNSQLVGEISLYNNENDPLVYTVDTYSGKNYYFGEKSDDGITIDKVIYKMDNEKDITISDFSNYHTIEYDDIIVNYNDDEFKIFDITEKSEFTFRSNELDDTIDSSNHINSKSKSFSKKNKKLSVTIQQCESPVTNEVVTVKYNGGKIAENIIPLKHIGNGVYQTNKPFGYSEIAQDKLYNDFNNYLIKGEKKCDSLKKVTNLLGKKIVSTLNSALDKDVNFSKKLIDKGIDIADYDTYTVTNRYVKWVKFLDKIEKLADVYGFINADTLEKVQKLSSLLTSRELLFCVVSDDLKDAGHYQELLIASKINEYFVDTNFPILINLKKENISRPFVYREGQQNNVEIILDSKAKFSNFSAPKKVNEDEAYDINITTECVDDEMSTVTVHGTDGYDFSDTKTLASGVSSFSYTIPGAVTGTTDTIKAVLHESNGDKVATKHLKLYFK